VNIRDISYKRVTAVVRPSAVALLYIHEVYCHTWSRTVDLLTIGHVFRETRQDKASSRRKSSLISTVRLCYTCWRENLNMLCLPVSTNIILIFWQESGGMSVCICYRNAIGMVEVSMTSLARGGCCHGYWLSFLSSSAWTILRDTWPW